MGKGKRIQDFRNLNMDSPKKEKEFIIEVQEKPRNTKNTKSYNEVKKKGKPLAKRETKLISKAKKETRQISKSKKDSQTYIEKEKAKKKKKANKQVSMTISIFLLIFITIGVVAGCLITPTFDIQSVQIEDGTNVKSAALKKYFSVIMGKNIFLISTSDLEDSVEQHPYVYKANVKRSFPNQVTVTYTERKPYLFLKYIESYVLMDKYGSLLEIKKENDMPELPIIYGIDVEEYIPGEKLGGIEGLKFENVVYLLETATQTNFEYTISEINYIDTEEMIISTKELNVEIIYGSIERQILNDKIIYLNQVLKQLGDKKGTLDISSDNYSEKVIFKEILK